MAFDPLHKWLGIPPAEQPPDYYRLLGLSPDEIDPQVIDSAADQRMAYLRQYQGGDYKDQAAQLLNHIATARRALLTGAGDRQPPAKPLLETPVQIRPHTVLAFSWAILGLAVVWTSVDALMMLGRVESAIQEAAVAAMWAAKVVAAYVFVRCIEGGIAAWARTPPPVTHQPRRRTPDSTGQLR